YFPFNALLYLLGHHDHPTSLRRRPFQIQHKFINGFCSYPISVGRQEPVEGAIDITVLLWVRGKNEKLRTELLSIFNPHPCFYPKALCFHRGRQNTPPCCRIGGYRNWVTPQQRVCLLLGCCKAGIEV